MKKNISRNIITSLDIGTSKVVALVGKRHDDGMIEIIGMGRCKSNGLKRGSIVDIEATIHAIKYAIHEAEVTAEHTIHNVYTGISGNHIHSLNSHGIVAIRNIEVSKIDIDRVIDVAKAVLIPADQKILHILPQEFIIDNQHNIKKPIGISGTRLETRIHIVTVAISAIQNIIKCIYNCGLEVQDIILEPLASSYSVLTEEEKELGVCLIDIGGGTTDIAVFIDGSIQYTFVIPIAGDQVTNDISIALRISTNSAEIAKINYACVLQGFSNIDEVITISNSNKKISSKTLSEIVSARYEELFFLIYTELKRNGLENKISAGSVITGGGSNIHGAVELAEICLNMPVRHGKSYSVVGLSKLDNHSSLATGIGLLLHGFKNYDKDYNISYFNKNSKKLFDRIKEWFVENF